jgi:hypothetical protein
MVVTPLQPRSTIMDYRYTDEDAVSVTITLTLHELDRLIAILEPISTDSNHMEQWRANDLNANFMTMRKQMVESAIESLQYRADRFKK